MKVHLTSFFLYGLIASHSALAIDPVYEGENGIRSNVFATNCLGCHSSDLVGGERHDAPFDVNFDTYEAALSDADDAINEVNKGDMPPAGSGFPLLIQEQKDALLAWQKAGYPLSNRSTYDIVTQRLNVPVVMVGDFSFSAVLTLFLTDQSPLGIGFELESAALTDQTSDNAAVFDPQTGLVDLPQVDLFNGEVITRTITGQMLLIEDSPKQFIVTSVE